MQFLQYLISVLKQTIHMITFAFMLTSFSANADVTKQDELDNAIITVRGRQMLPDEELRLKTVNYRLAVSNADRCSSPEMMTGLVVHDISYFDLPTRERLKADYDVAYGFGVFSVLRKSAAFWAGFKRGDQAIALDGTSLASFHPVENQTHGSFERTGYFELYLAKLLHEGPVNVTVQRSGKIIQIPFQGQLGCGGSVRLEDSTYDKQDLNGNAWYDGISAGVTRQLVDFTKDDNELAFVVAHQMAHNINGDFFRIRRTMFYREMSMSPGNMITSEKVADNTAVFMLIRTTYDPSASINFIARAEHARWLIDRKNHPDASQRIETVSSTISEIQLTSRQKHGTSINITTNPPKLAATNLIKPD